LFFKFNKIVAVRFRISWIDFHQFVHNSLGDLFNRFNTQPKVRVVATVVMTVVIMRMRTIKLTKR
ncbi:hypothetical protein OFN53_42775, partial [Escherichia coli]|nr:hypothetical protein [Escherichia coli]MCV5857369.1 hypothetical protein [Escherichia coli]